MSSVVVFAAWITASFGSGRFSNLFTSDEYFAIQQKRVRREVRDLSPDQWNRVAEAMNMMKNLSTAEGREMFGDDFINYDALVCQHAIANYDPLGDMGHIAPYVASAKQLYKQTNRMCDHVVYVFLISVFNIWHRAYVLSFENCLIAIDDEIQGEPYWDWRRDIIEQDDSVNVSRSIVFSDAYFGAYATNNENDFAVRNGRFANWKVHDNPDELGCGAFYQNAFGLLRNRDNTEGNPFVTRYGGTLCDGDSFAIGVLETYDFCLDNTTDFTEFVNCYNFDVHARAHIGVGGSRPAFGGQPSAGWPFCQFWHGASWTPVCGVYDLVYMPSGFIMIRSTESENGVSATAALSVRNLEHVRMIPTSRMRPGSARNVG